MDRASHTLAPAALIRRLLIVLALAALAVGLSAGAALADGDPASDVLVSQLSFIPSDTGATTAQQAKLTGLLRSATAAGYPVRVAIIPDAYDLGSVTALWRKPQAYAHFLGIELSYVHKQPLVVVMPDGIGFDWEGHHAAAQVAALARLAHASGPGLVAVAQSAVTTLAAGAHVKLAAPPSTTAARAKSKSGGISLAVPIALVVVLALVALGGATVLRRRPHRSEPGSPPVSKPVSEPVSEPRPAPAPQAPRPSRPAWAIPGIVLLMCLALATPIVALLALRHSTGTSVAADTQVATPFTWPADKRPAPNFTLTDQRGKRVKLAAYRGRPVILTFVDPLCRNLCPLAAHVLNQVDANMPRAQRPAIIAVSVDIYADSSRRSAPGLPKVEPGPAVAVGRRDAQTARGRVARLQDRRRGDHQTDRPHHRALHHAR